MSTLTLQASTTAAANPKPPDTAALLHPQMLPSGLVARLAQTATLPPPHPPESTGALIRTMLLSNSLGLDEKDHVLSQMPTLSVWQVRELMHTFDDERIEFAKLVPSEFEIIASLQARALWAALALAANRCGTSAAQERAWCKRTVRQAATRGLRHWLDTLDAKWWREHAAARWAYRDMYAAGHASWAD